MKSYFAIHYRYDGPIIIKRNSSAKYPPHNYFLTYAEARTKLIEDLVWDINEKKAQLKRVKGRKKF